MTVTAAAFPISGIFSYYCHENLPLIDYRPYKDGVVIDKWHYNNRPDRSELESRL